MAGSLQDSEVRFLARHGKTNLDAGCWQSGELHNLAEKIPESR
jgi:hypothetical protein